MPYVNKDGEQKFSLKEKVKYHNQCANSGKAPDGTQLTFTQRQNHAKASARCTAKLNRFARAKNMVCGNTAKSK